MGILDNGSHTINGGNSNNSGGGSSSGPKCFGKRLGKLKTICAGKLTCLLNVFVWAQWGQISFEVASEIPHEGHHNPLLNTNRT